FLERLLQSAVAREENSQRTGFNRTNRIDQSPRLRERCNMRVAEDFQMRAGELFAQRREHRQSKNKIPDGASAHDQDSARAHNISELGQIGATIAPGDRISWSHRADAVRSGAFCSA